MKGSLKKHQGYCVSKGQLMLNRSYQHMRGDVAVLINVKTKSTHSGTEGISNHN